MTGRPATDVRAWHLCVGRRLRCPAVKRRETQEAPGRMARGDDGSLWESGCGEDRRLCHRLPGWQRALLPAVLPGDCDELRASAHRGDPLHYLVELRQLLLPHRVIERLLCVRRLLGLDSPWHQRARIGGRRARLRSRALRWHGAGFHRVSCLSGFLCACSSSCVRFPGRIPQGLDS